MGVVYLGEARDCGQVAVKVVRPEIGDDQEFRARFRREVALLARVQGLCTVRVIDADTESASPFLVTEYASGPSLAEHIKSGGPLDPDMLYGLATGLAEALTAIHAAGVVHRDLKPGNVLLTREGPKVIDFGIAQALDGTVLTRTGTTMGSPGFMAPEQVIGTPGQPTDIFAWGLTVAYAGSGTQPFGTGPAEVLMYRVVHENPDIAAVPAHLRPLVAAALSKDPNARPAARDLLSQLTAEATRADTHPVADGQSHLPTQAVLARSWQAPAAPKWEPGRGPSARRSRRRPAAILAGAGALAALIGAGTAYAIGLTGHAASAAGQAAGVTGHAASTLPTVTFGSYTGREPSAIVLNPIDSTGTVQDIHWTSWTAAGASGAGTLNKVPAKVTLSSPVNGRFTRVGEITNGHISIQGDSGDDWPVGASPAHDSCAAPTAASLLAGWRASPTSVRRAWSGTAVTSFADIQCWKDWVVARPIGNGDGTFVFSRSGGLHLMPESDLQRFSDVVCGDPAAPEAWKGPLGPAVC